MFGGIFFNLKKLLIVLSCQNHQQLLWDLVGSLMRLMLTDTKSVEMVDIHMLQNSSWKKKWLPLNSVTTMAMDSGQQEPCAHWPFTQTLMIMDHTPIKLVAVISNASTSQLVCHSKNSWSRMLKKPMMATGEEPALPSTEIKPFWRKISYFYNCE